MTTIRGCYDELAAAIIFCAVKDYKAAARKVKRNPQNYEARYRKGECKQFFISDWFDTLVCLSQLDINGDKLLKALESEGAAHK